MSICGNTIAARALPGAEKVWFLQSPSLYFKEMGSQPRFNFERLFKKNIPMNKTSKLLVPTRNEAGFTLIEVMVSLTIMTVGILGLLSSVNTVNHYQRHSKDMTLATMHSTNKLEEVKRVATNEPTGGAFGFGYLVDDTASGFLNGYTASDDWTRSSSDTIDGLTRSWSISVYPASSQTAAQSFLVPGAVRMVEAVVTTSWTDEKGGSKSVEVATVLHRRQFLGVN